MKYCLLVWTIASLLYAFHSHAAVRTVEATERAITPIYLSLGRSTVLRFRERPKKVVVGNQNYYNVEFIENDLAIQPTGTVPTNLFVYGESHTYGFSLHVSGAGADDLVHVLWWMPRTEERTQPTKEIVVKNVDKVFNLGPGLQMRVGKLIFLKSQNVMWLETHLLSNVKEKPKVSTKQIEIRLFGQGGGEIKSRFVCSDEVLTSFEDHGCRLFFPAVFNKGFLARVKFKNKISQLSF